MLFAKIKGFKGTPPQHRVLASDEESVKQFYFYTIPNIHEGVKFNPDRKLEQSQWYYVELTSDHIAKMIDPYTDNEKASADLSNTVQADYEVVEVVYRVYGKAAIFTKITNSYRVTNKRFMKFLDLEQVKVVEEGHSIEFSGEVHAYYDGRGKLYFRDFSKVRSMFPGIDDFYREATREEKQRFLDNEVFNVTELEAEHIGQLDSKRIALVLEDENIKFELDATRQKIIDSAKHYAEEKGIEITDNNQIVLASPQDLKKALNIILSKYYISEITGQKMESYGSAAMAKDKMGQA